MKKETGGNQPEKHTPDWYDRHDCCRLSEHGVRGTLPGAGNNAEIINSGLFKNKEFCSILYGNC